MIFVDKGDNIFNTVNARIVFVWNKMHLSAFLGKEIELSFDDNLYSEELSKRVKTSKAKKNTKSVFADTGGRYVSKEMAEEHYKLK